MSSSEEASSDTKVNKKMLESIEATAVIRLIDERLTTPNRIPNTAQARAPREPKTSGEARDYYSHASNSS